MRTKFKLALAGALLAVSQLSLAAYPAKPIKAVVPFPAGGATDVVGRPFADALSEVLQKPVVIENRGGAGGAIGASAVAKAKPDGYTLLIGTVGTTSINPALYSQLSYNPETELEAIAVFAEAPVVLVAHPSFGINTVDDLRAKAKEKNLRFATAGSGTPGHLTGELFKTKAGIELQDVPYKGGAPATQDLLGAHVELMFDPLQSILPYIQSGQLTAIAISSTERHPLLPNVPTFSEVGVDVTTTAWWGLFSPKGIDAEVKKTLVDASTATYSSAQLKKLADIGITIVPPKSQAELDKFLADEKKLWADAVAVSGAKIN